MNTRDRGNFMDGFFPQLGVMARFWLCGVIMAALGGAWIWFAYRGDSWKKANMSDYASAGNLIVMWIVLLAILGICYGAYRSEGGSIKGKDGAGSTKAKQGPIMAGIIGGLLLLIAIIFTVLSIKFYPG